MMDSLATAARQRTLMTTIADAILTASAGKNLRVAVGWSSPDESVFADQLTRALLARGLPCRCLLFTSNPTGRDNAPAVMAGSPTVAVITSAADDGAELCRINIELSAGGLRTAPDDADRPDIVVDYLDPDGPAIHHIVPALAPLLTR